LFLAISKEKNFSIHPRFIAPQRFQRFVAPKIALFNGNLGRTKTHPRYTPRNHPHNKGFKGEE
jgi:hypothetical protein